MFFHESALRAVATKWRLVYSTAIAGLALVALSAFAVESDDQISSNRRAAADQVLDASIYTAALDQPLQESSNEEADAASTQGNSQEEPIEPSQEELAEEAERAFNMFLRDQKILFLKGEVEYELSFATSTDTQHNVRFNNLVVPTLSSYSTSLSFMVRYALTNDFEINLSVPFSNNETDYEFLFLESPAPDIENARDSGVGDIQTGFRYQWFREQGLRPDISLSLDYKPDSGSESVGSNDQSLSFKTTMVKTIDPAVFFFELGYEYTWENEGLNRGNSVFGTFGTGFSLNDRVSYNVQYNVRVIDEIRSDGIAIKGTDRDIASVQFGTTIRLSKDVYFEPFLDIGLSDDANDFSVGFSVPF